MGLKPFRRIITAGSFDILNCGHIRLFQRAKDLCDTLIVLVSSDELIREHKGILPIMPFDERYSIIEQLKCVDMVFVQTNLVNIWQFHALSGDMFVLGDDWKDRDDVHGIKWLKDNNKIIFFPYTKEVSSSIIKERIIKNSEGILKAQKARKSNGK